MINMPMLIRPQQSILVSSGDFNDNWTKVLWPHETECFGQTACLVSRQRCIKVLLKSKLHKLKHSGSGICFSHWKYRLLWQCLTFLVTQWSQSQNTGQIPFQIRKMSILHFFFSAMSRQFSKKDIGDPKAWQWNYMILKGVMTYKILYFAY